jgi:hypothetical protein
MLSHTGVICRHVFRVLLQQNAEAVPDEAIDERWLQTDERAGSTLIATLREQAVARAPATRSATAQVGMTADERYAEALATGRVLAEIAALTPAYHKVIMSKMQGLVSSARAGALLPASHGSKTAAAARAAAEAETARAAAVPHTAPGGVASAATGAAPPVRNPASRAGAGEGGKRTQSFAERAKATGVAAGKSAAAAAKAAEAAAADPKPKRPRNAN